jgi:hypothetical protein
MNERKVFDIRIKRFNEVTTFLNNIGNRGSDVSRVFEAFIPIYQDAIRENWNLSGKLMGKRWKGLSPEYRKWKTYLYRNGESLSKKADLTVSGTLKNAATGGEHWFQEIGATTLRMGIEGLPYSNIHQEGGTIPARTIQITDKMRKFFWFMWGLTSDDKYKAMALTRKTEFHIPAVKMPQRPYLKSFNQGIPGKPLQKFIDMLQNYIINGVVQ